MAAPARAMEDAAGEASYGADNTNKPSINTLHWPPGRRVEYVIIQVPQLVPVAPVADHSFNNAMYQHYVKGEDSQMGGNAFACGIAAGRAISQQGLLLNLAILFFGAYLVIDSSMSLYKAGIHYSIHLDSLGNFMDKPIASSSTTYDQDPSHYCSGSSCRCPGHHNRGGCRLCIGWRIVRCSPAHLSTTQRGHIPESSSPGVRAGLEHTSIPGCGGGYNVNHTIAGAGAIP